MTLLRWVGPYFHQPPEASPVEGEVTEQPVGGVRRGWVRRTEGVFRESRAHGEGRRAGDRSPLD